MVDPNSDHRIKIWLASFNNGCRNDVLATRSTSHALCMVTLDILIISDRKFDDDVSN